jgi:hypothetical protein
VFNPHAAIPASKVRQLFEYEMLLSEQAVAMFRSLAYMIVVAGFFYNKKRQLTAGSTNGKPPSIGEGVPGWEKIFIGWREILRIHTELFEVRLNFWYCWKHSDIIYLFALGTARNCISSI